LHINSNFFDLYTNIYTKFLTMFFKNAKNDIIVVSGTAQEYCWYWHTLIVWKWRRRQCRKSKEANTNWIMHVLFNFEYILR